MRCVDQALRLLDISGLVANAWHGPVELELVYDDTPEKREHEYLQVFVTEETPEMIPSRRIPVDELVTCMRAIDVRPDDKVRLNSATAQYIKALEHWRPGQQFLAVSYLFMGMEALKPLAVTRHLSENSVSPADQAHAWGYRAGKGHMRQADFLLSEIRRRVLFNDDIRCHKVAKTASDTWEHGFTITPEMRRDAEEVVVQTASYLRTAILRLAGIDEATQTKLLAPPYAEPIGQLVPVKYLRGLLSASGPLAAPTQRHPSREWGPSNIVQVTRDDKGNYRANIKTNVGSWKVADGITSKSEKLEVWDGSKLQQKPVSG